MIDNLKLRMTIAANVKRLREEKGFSQGELAELVGISRVTLNRVENAHNTLSADLLYGLADALAVSTDTLRQVADEKQRAKKLARTA